MKQASDFADAELRVFDRQRVSVDDDIRSVYLIGICGTGMGSLAGLFCDAGFDVSGSDANAYPPMSTRLRDAGIQVFEGYDAANLDHKPDLVVVGNACTPQHPEATRARDEGMSQLSFPEAFSEFFVQKRRSLVVAGTHGKTTTSGLLAHTFSSAGLDPTFLVGGVLCNGNTSFNVGSGRHCIVEGDEYDSAYFDKRPKFMLYRPDVAVVTSMEFDHADIYDDWEDYKNAFRRFVGLLPEDGRLILNTDSEPVSRLASHTGADITTYGLVGSPDIRARDIVVDPTGVSFDLVRGDAVVCRMTLPATGRHNLANALAVASVGLAEGLEPDAIREAFASFKGLKRRQEIIGDISDVLVLDDFAHHPTAVSVTIAGVRERWPTRRLIAVFEPRSNSSRRKVFEQQYVNAFKEAHQAIIAEPPFRHNDRHEDFMDIGAICHSLTAAGVGTYSAPDQAALRERLGNEMRAGDIVLIMSNGGFGGLHDWVLSELTARS